MRLPILTLLAAFLAPCAVAGTARITVVDRDGRPVPDAVVALTPLQRPSRLPALPLVATIEQQNMRFVPAVTVVAAGARVRFVNQDSYDHHVRGTRAEAMLENTAGSGFEFRLGGRVGTAAPATAEATLNQVGPVLLGCHIHGSMRGYLFVSDTPWAAKTSADGSAALDLPDGAAELRVWQADLLLPPAATRIEVLPTGTETRVQLNVAVRGRRI
jgi:plastocyanin